MERYSSEYLETHYNADAENSTLIKDTRYVADGNEEGLESYRALRAYLDRGDLDDPEVYAGLLEQMDMQSFIDWMCTNIYIANTDSKPLENNVYTWKSDAPANSALSGYLEYSDGKWRWMLYDLDDSLAVGASLEKQGSLYACHGFLHRSPRLRAFWLPGRQAHDHSHEKRRFPPPVRPHLYGYGHENFRADRVLALLNEIEKEYSAWADISWKRWNAKSPDKTFPNRLRSCASFLKTVLTTSCPVWQSISGWRGNWFPFPCPQEPKARTPP